jgi:hypothetical protein
VQWNAKRRKETVPSGITRQQKTTLTNSLKWFFI